LEREFVAIHEGIRDWFYAFLIVDHFQRRKRIDNGLH